MASTEELRPNARHKSGTSITSEYEMNGFAHEDLEFSEGDKYFVCQFILNILQRGLSEDLQ